MLARLPLLLKSLSTATKKKQPIQNPGSHGSTKWYYDQQGHVIYGERPLGHKGLHAGNFHSLFVAHAPKPDKLQAMAEFAAKAGMPEQHVVGGAIAAVSKQHHEAAQAHPAGSDEHEEALNKYKAWLAEVKKAGSADGFDQSLAYKQALSQAEDQQRALAQEHKKLKPKPPMVAGQAPQIPGGAPAFTPGENPGSTKAADSWSQGAGSGMDHGAALDEADRFLDRPGALEALVKYLQDHPSSQYGMPQASQVASDPSAARLAASHFMESIKSHWDNSSCDSGGFQCQFQYGVIDEFQLPDSAVADLAHHPHVGTKKAQEAYDAYLENPDLWRHAARAMYEYGQERFKELGITHVTLYRGTGIPTTDAPWADQEYGQPSSLGGFTEQFVGDFALNPLTSWSTKKATAQSFGSGQSGHDRHGALIMATIPVEQLFSAGRTGCGTVYEHEFVVLTGNGDKVVYLNRAYGHKPQNNTITTATPVAVKQTAGGISTAPKKAKTGSAKGGWNTKANAQLAIQAAADAGEIDQTQADTLKKKLTWGYKLKDIKDYYMPEAKKQHAAQSPQSVLTAKIQAAYGKGELSTMQKDSLLSMVGDFSDTYVEQALKNETLAHAANKGQATTPGAGLQGGWMGQWDALVKAGYLIDGYKGFSQKDVADKMDATLKGGWPSEAAILMAVVAEQLHDTSDLKSNLKAGLITPQEALDQLSLKHNLPVLDLAHPHALSPTPQAPTTDIGQGQAMFGSLWDAGIIPEKKIKQAGFTKDIVLGTIDKWQTNGYASPLAAAVGAAAGWNGEHQLQQQLLTKVIEPEAALQELGKLTGKTMPAIPAKAAPEMPQTPWGGQYKALLDAGYITYGAPDAAVAPAEIAGMVQNKLENAWKGTSPEAVLAGIVAMQHNYYNLANDIKDGHISPQDALDQLAQKLGKGKVSLAGGSPDGGTAGGAGDLHAQVSHLLSVGYLQGAHGDALDAAEIVDSIQNHVKAGYYTSVEQGLADYASHAADPAGHLAYDLKSGKLTPQEVFDQIAQTKGKQPYQLGGHSPGTTSGPSGPSKPQPDPKVLASLLDANTVNHIDAAEYKDLYTAYTGGTLTADEVKQTLAEAKDAHTKLQAHQQAQTTAKSVIAAAHSAGLLSDLNHKNLTEDAEHVPSDNALLTNPAKTVAIYALLDASHKGTLPNGEFGETKQALVSGTKSPQEVIDHLAELKGTDSVDLQTGKPKGMSQATDSPEAFKTEALAQIKQGIKDGLFDATGGKQLMVHIEKLIQEGSTQAYETASHTLKNYGLNVAPPKAQGLAEAAAKAHQVKIQANEAAIDAAHGKGEVHPGDLDQLHNLAQGGAAASVIKDALAKSKETVEKQKKAKAFADLGAQATEAFSKGEMSGVQHSTIQDIIQSGDMAPEEVAKYIEQVKESKAKGKALAQDKIAEAHAAGLISDKHKADLEALNNSGQPTYTQIVGQHLSEAKTAHAKVKVTHDLIDQAVSQGIIPAYAAKNHHAALDADPTDKGAKAVTDTISQAVADKKAQQAAQAGTLGLQTASKPLSYNDAKPLIEHATDAGEISQKHEVLLKQAVDKGEIDTPAKLQEAIAEAQAEYAAGKAGQPAPAPSTQKYLGAVNTVTQAIKDSQAAGKISDLKASQLLAGAHLNPAQTQAGLAAAEEHQAAQAQPPKPAGPVVGKAHVQAMDAIHAHKAENKLTGFGEKQLTQGVTKGMLKPEHIDQALDLAAQATKLFGTKKLATADYTDAIKAIGQGKLDTAKAYLGAAGTAASAPAASAAKAEGLGLQNKVTPPKASPPAQHPLTSEQKAANKQTISDALSAGTLPKPLYEHLTKLYDEGKMAGEDVSHHLVQVIQLRKQGLAHAGHVERIWRAIAKNTLTQGDWDSLAGQVSDGHLTAAQAIEKLLAKLDSKAGHPFGKVQPKAGDHALDAATVKAAGEAIAHGHLPTKAQMENPAHQEAVRAILGAFERGDIDEDAKRALLGKLGSGKLSAGNIFAELAKAKAAQQQEGAGGEAAQTA